LEKVLKKWLIIVAVAGVVLIGSGIGFILKPGTVSSPALIVAGKPVTLPPGIEVPQGVLAFSLGTVNRNATTASYLYIYENGSVLRSEEASPRQDLGRPGFRIWKCLQLTQAEFAGLADFIQANAAGLEVAYQFPGYAGPGGTPLTGDMDTGLVIKYQSVNKTVSALNYLSPYSDYFAGTYAGMPSPLGEICQKLNEIAVRTQEFSRENIE
jgi:hypothetical protein